MNRRRVIIRPLSVLASLRCTVRALWLVSVAFASTPAHAHAPVDRATTSGLAVGAALGSESPLFGGVLLYYLQLENPRLRVALHAGAGGVPSAIAGERSFGVSGGAFLGFGRRHRLVVGLSAGTQNWTDFSLHGVTLAVQPNYGGALTVGWEWMTRRGFFMRMGLGPAFYVTAEAPLLAREVHASLNGTLAIGYKLW
jgi:hypothetical protein